MPDETAIRRIEELLTEITRLGGQNERTSIVSNLTVVDAAPTGLTNFITIADERDGDTILAKTVPGVIYAVSDKVNVLFVEGTEPIAFQQGSESPSAGLWEIVPSTSTDIFYDKGNVGIGISAPSALIDADQSDSGGAKPVLKLDQGDTSEQGIQFSSDSVDRDINLYTVDVTGTPTMLWDESADSSSWNKGFIINPTNLTKILFQLGGSSDQSLVNITTTVTASLATPQILRFIPTIDPNATATSILGINTTPVIGGSGSDAITNFVLYTAAGQAGGSYGGTITNMFDFRALNFADNSSGAPAVTNQYAFWTQNLTFATNNFGIYQQGTAVRNQLQGDTGIGLLTTPSAQLHVDQPSTTAAQPVALFDQADVSEEMFEFVCTIGVGNAIEAIGAKTLTTTHFIKVTIPGGLTRYFPVGTIA